MTIRIGILGYGNLGRGIECAKEFINKFILADIKDKQLFVDSKTILQERIQAGYKEGPEYNLKIFEFS